MTPLRCSSCGKADASVQLPRRHPVNGFMPQLCRECLVVRARRIEREAEAYNSNRRARMRREVARPD